MAMWFVGILPLFAASSAEAATHLWSGLGDGVHWSDAANWVGGAPATGEPGGTAVAFAGGVTSTDDIAGLVLDQLHFASGNNTVNGNGSVSLAFSNAVFTVQILNDAGASVLAGTLPIGTGSGLLVHSASGQVTIAGVVSGSGGVTLQTGTLALTGVNSFTGTTMVDDGILQAGGAGVSVPGNAQIGDNTGALKSAILRSLGADSVSSTHTVTIVSDGEWDLNGFTNGASRLSMTGGAIAGAGASRLALTNATATSLAFTSDAAGNAAAITAPIRLDSAQSFFVVTPGPGNVDFDAACAISEAAVTTLQISGGGLMKEEGSAANSYSTTALLDGRLLLNKPSGVQAIGSELLIGGPSAFAEVDLQSEENIQDGAFVWVKADSLFFVDGGPETIAQLRIDGGTGSRPSGHVHTDNLGELILSGGFLAHPVGSSDSDVPTFDGVLDIRSSTVTVNVDAGPNVYDLHFEGAILGSGTLVKLGPGLMLFLGETDPALTVQVANGALHLGASEVKGTVSLLGGTLSGEGEVGTLTTTSGTVSPGFSPGAFVTLNNLALNTPATHFVVEVNGLLPDAEFDVLRPQGPASINQATLSVSAGFVPAPGTQFAIIEKSGASPVTGTFAGLPDGSVFQVNNGVLFRINYNAGVGGNDVVLTTLGQAAVPTMPQWLLIIVGGGSLALVGCRLQGRARRVSAVAIVVLSALALARPASAALHTWTGAGDGVHWSDAANWTNGVPTTGEAGGTILSFGTNTTSTDDIANLTVDQVTFGNGNTINGSVTLGFAATLGVEITELANSTNTINVHIQTPAAGLSYQGIGATITFGLISGQGGVTINTGTVNYTANNTYLGQTWLRSGQLTLNVFGGGVPGDLKIGDDLAGPGTAKVVLLQPEGIASNHKVTIRPDGQLDLQDHTQTLTQLDMTGGSIVGDPTSNLRLDSTSPTALTMIASAAGNAATIATGHLTLVTSQTFFAVADGPGVSDLDLNSAIGEETSATLTKLGDGRMQLLGSAANTVDTLLTQAGNLVLKKDPGVAAAQLAFVMGGGSSIGVMSNESADNVPDTALVRVRDNGMYALFAPETIGGLALENGDNFGGRVQTDNDLTLTGPITVTKGSGAGNWPANVIGSIDLGGGTRIVTVAEAAAQDDFQIQATTNGNLIKQGPGRMEVAFGPQTGFLQIDQGSVVLMDGVVIDGNIIENGGRLLGAGTGGAIVVNGGTVAPGFSPGTLHSTGSLVFNAASAIYEVEINGTTPGTDYDQLTAGGSVAINAGTLNVTAGFAPPIGSQFTIISKTSGGQVTGAFTGLPEGAVFQASNGAVFQINYNAGSGGNDVVLTTLAVTAVPTMPQWLLLILAGAAMAIVGRRLQGRGRRIVPAAVVVLGTLAHAVHADAATHTWTGGGDGVHWSDGANWTGGAPSTGEPGGTIVVFTGFQLSTDDIAGLVVDQVHFTANGNQISGTTSLGFSGSVLATQILNDGGNQSFSSSLPITIANGFRVSGGPGPVDDVEFNAPISGASPFELVQGTAVIVGGNSYTGDTLIDDGALFLFPGGNGVGIPGKVVIGDGSGAAASALLSVAGSHASDTQLMTIKSDGKLLLQGNAQTLSQLTMTGGLIDVQGAGQLTLAPTAPFAINLTSDSAGGAAVIKPPVVLASPVVTVFVTDGPGLIDATIDGPISDSGGSTLQKAFLGTLLFSGTQANSHHRTEVTGGTLRLNKTANVAAVASELQIGNGTQAASVIVASTENIANNVVVQVDQNGTLTLLAQETIGGLILNGSETLPGGAVQTTNQLTLSGDITVGSGPGNAIFWPTITGSVNLAGGTRTISGDGAMNMQGTTNGNLIKNGQAFVDVTSGTITGSVLMNLGGLRLEQNAVVAGGVTILGGELDGWGTASSIDTQAGSVAPGPIDRLRSTGAFSLGTADSGLIIHMQNQTPGSGYGQLRTGGPVALNSGRLVIGISFVPPINSQFTIIDNTGGAPISGTFLNLPDGAIIPAQNGTLFRINYNVGTGSNDVVLTVIGAAAVPTMPQWLLLTLAGGALALVGRRLQGRARMVIPAAVVLVGSLAHAPAADAATHTWTGGGDGVHWSDGANWNGGVPATGEPGGTIVVFTGFQTSTDDIVGLVVDQVHFTASSNQINGTTPLGFSGSVLGTQVLNDAGQQAFTSTLPITIANGFRVSAGPGAVDNVAFDAVISGNTTFELLLGTAILGAANTNTGDTWVDDGQLILDGSGTVDLAGDLVIGDQTGAASSAKVLLNGGLASATRSVTIYSDGELSLQNNQQSLVKLNMTGGLVDSVSGGQLTLTSASVTDFTLTSDAAGHAASITAPIVLAHSPVDVNVTDGPGSTDADLSGAISGSPMKKTSSGTLVLEGAAPNTFGGLQVDNGTIYLNKPVGVDAVAQSVSIGGGGGLATVHTAHNEQIPDDIPIQVVESGVLELGGGANETLGEITIVGSGSGTPGTITTFVNSTLVMNGDISASSTGNGSQVPLISGAFIPNGTRTIHVADSPNGIDLKILGNPIGTGTIVKDGAGTLLSDAVWSQSGGIVLNQGVLQLGNSSAVNNGVVVNGGRLAGTGSLGSALLNGGTIAPGASPGILFDQGPLTFGAPAAAFEVEINGTTAGTGYDQISVSGPVSLGGATLNVIGNIIPAVNTQFTIISNTGAGAVAGQFAGLGEGAIFQANNGELFRINYNAGAGGNDVVLTALGATPVPTMPQWLLLIVAGGSLVLVARRLRGRTRLLIPAAIVILGTFTHAAPANASTHTWTGAGDGLNWSDAANWTGGAPTSGEPGGTILVFGTGVTTNDNIAGLIVDQLHFTTTGNAVSATVALTLRGGVAASQVLNDTGSNTFAPSAAIVLQTADGVFTMTSGSVVLNAPISGSVGLVKNGSGTLAFGGTLPNTYTGTTTVSDGALDFFKPTGVDCVPAGLDLGGGTNPATIQTAASEQIHDGTLVRIRAHGALNLATMSETIGPLELYIADGNAAAISTTSGTLTLGGDVTVLTSGAPTGTALIDGNVMLNAIRTFNVTSGSSASQLTMTGTIAGGGGITKTNIGIMAIGAIGTYTSATSIANGALEILPTGDISTSAVTINGVNGPSLVGDGSTGPISAIAGAISPGHLGAAAGILTSAGTLAMTSTGHYQVQLLGLAPGSGYDQIVATGTQLTDAALNLNVSFNPPVGSQFTIIHNTSGNVTGQFAGLPDGAVIPLGVNTFRINYNAGANGHDVVLTAIDPAPVPTMPQWLLLVLSLSTALAIVERLRRGAVTRGRLG